MLVFALGTVEAKKRLDQILVVEASVENFRAEPNGTKIGTLLEGGEIEQIGAEGQWVRFRVEGWIWGRRSRDSRIQKTKTVLESPLSRSLRCRTMYLGLKN